jgi:hypothetical protein
VTADLDTLLTAAELTDRIIASWGITRSGPGKPPKVTDAELVYLTVVQVLLRYDDERRRCYVGSVFTCRRASR